jgi:hypothetical protein
MSARPYRELPMRLLKGAHVGVLERLELRDGVELRRLRGLGAGGGGVGARAGERGVFVRLGELAAVGGRLRGVARSGLVRGGGGRL